MNILHVINNLANGGAERLLVDFLPHLNTGEYNVSLLILVRSGSLVTYIEELESAGITVHVLKETGSLYDVRFIYSLNSFLNSGQYDVIHAHLFPLLYYLATVKRLFFRKESFYFTEHSINNRRIGNPKFRLLEKWIYKSFKKTVVISQSIKNKLDDWLDMDDHTIVIRNGINLSKFLLTKVTDLPLIGGRKKGFKYLLMTARFDIPKRQDELIKVAKELPENYVLLFAGIGSNMHKCQELVKDLNISHRVEFLGHRADIPCLMKSVDLNILYSDYEGMSGVAIEALAAGKPFLGSNVPGINDVVPDALNLFDNFKTLEIASKIIDLCSKQQDHMVNIQFLQSQKFTMNLMVEGYRELYYEGVD